MNPIQIFRCRRCGNVIVHLCDSGAPVVCCGANMELLVPTSFDTFAEKHVPVVKREGDKVIVKVGRIAHPMVVDHCIEWILLRQKGGFQLRWLLPDDAPRCEFKVCDANAPLTIYAFCNLHGLWMASL